MPYFASMRRLTALAAIGPHVAAGHEPHVRLLHEAADDVGAAAADADAAHHDLLAGRHGPVLAQHEAGHHRRRGQQGPGLEGPGEKPSP